MPLYEKRAEAQQEWTQGKFWMVLGMNGGPPRYKHPSLEQANLEAKRLARISHGEIFVVLETVAAHCVRPTPVTQVPLCRLMADDLIPF